MSANPQTYINHSLNLSKTKCSFSFSKANRFHKARPLQTEPKYNLPNTLARNTCSFGFGNKASLIDRRCSPPPGTYQPPSDFSPEKKRTQTPALGYGRDTVVFGSYLEEAKGKGRNLPSPDKYDIQLPKNKVGGVMGTRLSTQPCERKHKNVPGPGSYNLEKIEMANSSNFVLSTMKKSTSPRYKNNTIEQGHLKARSSIFSYDIQEKRFGHSRTSKFRNISVGSFSKSKRPGPEDVTRLSVPGFKYKLFSEFGLSQ